MEHQDWKDVVIKRKKTKSTNLVKSTQIKQKNPNSVNIKLETEDIPLKTISSELSQQIQKARLDKNMTQKQLAVAINEKVNIIQSYENGTAQPKYQIINKLSKVLGVSLKNSK